MENKQIIIDNIDVSGCEYYFDEKCRCMDASIMQDFYSCPQCNSNTNCNYKKWQRKEQECERLKQTCGLRPELKYIIDKTCCKYNINAKYYHEKIVEIINNLDKYKQTLAEIKEFVKNEMTPNCDTNIILQKISECEVKYD